MNNYEIIKTGVLVIGSGAAGLRAACSACESGADVLLVSKGKIAQSGGTYYSVAELGAFNVPDGEMDPTDSPEVFYNDIMAAALGECDPKLARILAEEALMNRIYLEEAGLELARKPDGSYLMYRGCFSSKPRSHVVKNHFKPLAATLGKKVREYGIKCMEGVTVTNLLMHDGKCCGAFALVDGKLVCFVAGAVVMAVGGGSTVFAHNMYPDDISGDGYAMGARAGAVIKNMEFVQAGLGLAKPSVNLFGHQLWEALPRVRNGKGETFMYKYAPKGESDDQIAISKLAHFPFSCRDLAGIIEISIQSEINKGNGTPDGNIWLDFINSDFESIMNDPNSQLASMWDITYERFKGMNIDLYKEPIEIACFAHAVNGGILINEEAQSSIEGLYAAGEVAAGPHGADRLGGNMSITTQVFGRRAGMFAAEKAAKCSLPDASDINFKAEEEFLAGLGTLSKEDVRGSISAIQKACDRDLLIIKDEESINDCLSVIDSVDRNMKEPFAGDDAATREDMLKLRNMADTARLMADAALARRESLGSHFRSDYPPANYI